MIPDKEKREKVLKKEIVEMRNIIKKKYQQLYDKSVKDERDLKEKYTPITDSIEQLIESKALNQEKIKQYKLNKLKMQ